MDWLSGITAFDILIFLIFAAFLARGIWIGFIRQFSSLIGMVGGFILAGYFDNDFYRLLLPFISNGKLAFLLTYILLFTAFFFLIKLLGLGLKKVMDVTLTIWFDRTVGGIFGFIKAIFFVSLLFIVINSFLSGSNNYLKKSLSYPLLSKSSKVILAFIQDHDLRSYFTPREPAIRLSPFKNSSESLDSEKLHPGAEPEKRIESGGTPAAEHRILL